ncbi:hypothetical protein QTP70_015394 [Hemibagrus guttatus]|uniref:Nuclear pore complex protein Nup214 n=1 Tax=Hemibagrus guttatus TaxID=175788 RepID=A0AAE0PVW1_9TELE|nr:hypothetical protein QTP70_015394 [Hemibagrus guttatus]
MGDDIPEREMKDFQFRQMKKIRVFDSPNDLPRERSNLLAISNKFGLTFVGRGRVLKVFVTDDIITAGKVSGNTNEIVEGVKCQALTVDLPMHHLALSSDELTLSVCGASQETALTLDFYDVRTFFNKTRQDKRPFASFKAGSQPDTLVHDLKWSPVEAFRVAACLSDGSMMVLDVTDKIVPVAQLLASVSITCVCWSPKGKQIAAGKQDATVVQYTPDLQQKKVIPCPSFYTADNPVKVLDVLWLSTYNFAVVYSAADGSLETPPELVMVSLPKKDENKVDKFLNFGEIVFGSCTERQHHYFLNHIEDWDLILAASATSIEVSIIAKQEDKTNWELWLLEDASRGELPVTLNNEDTLPVGVAIDYTGQGEIHITDEKKLPPAPTLLILSSDGVLCPFSLINLNPGVKQLVMSAGSLPQSGERPPLQKSLPPPQAPATSKPPPPVFSPFQMPFITPASSSAPPASSAAPASASSGLSFSLPSTASSLFSFSAASSTSSIFPSASGFSFAPPKPASEAPSVPAFTSAISIKPLMEDTGASGHMPTATATVTASPITLLKGGMEPATPNVRVNLNDRFLSAEAPNLPAPSTQPFSFTSTPKPAVVPESSGQPKPVFNINKPAPPTVTCPAPAQNSAPSAAVQKTTPAPTAISAPPSTQLSSVKFVEKQLQQTKDSDPVMVGIQEEISHFKKELDELKERVKAADFCVGSSDEMRELRKESEDLQRFTLEIKETTESMHGDISTLKTMLLEGFAGAEEARAQRELNRDKGYLQLLYKKPLDPRSESQLKEIRRLYQYVKFTMEDVNDVLDLEWEKHLEKKRKQNESREQVEENLERERRGMKVSGSKTEYMCVNEREGSGTVRLQDEEVKKVQEFKYLGSTVQSNGECGKEVKKRVQAGWNGWRKVWGVLCDQKISARIKGKVYRTVVRAAMLYGLETVSLRKRQESELEVAELKMLWFSLGVTRLDRIRNEYIRGTAHVGRLGDKVREARLRWFGHVQRRESEYIGRRMLDMELPGRRQRGRPKRRYMIVPEREALYTALANNMDIINQQKQKLEHLVRDLQSLRLYNKTSSQLSSTSSPAPSSSSQGLDSELESLKNALLKACLDTTPKPPSKSPSKMTPVKQSQLRNFLSKRQTPPVRSTAPGNLSRSAFLSPKYFEDLDDVSSTSSLYQPLECDEPLPVPEEVEVSQPVLNPPRHPTVVRTSSILPRSIIDSAPLFPGATQWPGIITGPRAVPKINMDSADSTALATKTVMHGPLPTEKATSLEKTTPTPLLPAQAAGKAALNRHMNSQKPMTNLTELTLKNVPQVVNVQELKDNGSNMPVSTDISASMASSADQTLQQVLATVEAKKPHSLQNPTQSAVKVHPPVSESAPAQPSFVFSQLPKHDTAVPFSLPSSMEQQINKGVSPAGFSFNLSTTSSQSQGASSSQSVTQLGKIPQKPAQSLMNEPGKSSTIPPFQVPRAQEDSLGPFLDLRVGPGEEVKESPKPGTTFTFKPPSTGPGMTFTFGNPPKPAATGNNSESSSTTTLEAAKNPGIFKPPESAASLLTSKKFSFAPASSASIPSFSSLLAVPLPQETPSVPEKPAEPELSPPPESVSTTTPEEPSSEPSAEASAISTSTPSPASVTEEPPPSQPKQEEPETPATQTTPVPEATPTSTPSLPETVPVTASKPVQETTPAPTVTVEQQPPAAEPAAPAPPSTTPGSIFTQPPVSSNSTTLSVTVFTPVISTAAVSMSAPTSVFSQAVSTSSTPAFGSSGFGATSTTSSFGKPVFGQSTSAGFPSASGFTFGQFAFGGSSGFGQTSAPSTTPAPASSSGGGSAGGGGGGLFGSGSSTSASSFSFGSSSTSSGVNTGSSIFGQSSAPAFGQSSSTSMFGQGSLFGGNTATPTTSSGFSFGQPAAFNSTSSSSVFGQQQSTNIVFGQPSSGGSLFGSGAASSSGSSGGGFFSGLGGKPSEDAANKNPFGSTNTSAFGQTNQTGGSLFGNSGAKTFGFGNSTFGDQKASGTFSAGGGSVAAHGFGSFSSPTKSGGFGSPAVFGSPPSFGGSPAFGGQATFGSAPAFNSPLGSSTGKVFGEGTSAASVGGFGFASPPSGPSFGSLASQNTTPTFGSLAQQTPGFGGQSGGFSGFGPSGGEFRGIREHEYQPHCKTQQPGKR